ncbi:TetR/AcrR family transcriptional regulator [Allokutzneria sp. NRRL B-24872]|uniref:TetR/AcrR family transcriptional regulator n=1 Tax=Allokutzneria sp. NRRL B-24872 TaxID=1137961 RepID=UPI000A37081D|nr:TetR/AcrR family transcriptional regulator [Allokutzneria sp. NRRL B-24872]
MTGKRAENRRRNTDALVSAARGLFTEHGYEAVGIEAIAEEAGLTTGAIYSIFGAKHGLLLAVLDEVFDQLGAAVLPLRQDSGLSAEEVLEGYAAAYRAIVSSLDGQRVLRLELEALALTLRDERMRERVTERDLTRSEDVVHLLTNRRTDSGPLDEERARRMAVALTALMRGLAQQHVLKPGSVEERVWTSSARALTHALC